MLRLATLDTAGAEAGLPVVPPALVTRALGGLVSERAGFAPSGFAIDQLCTALLDDVPRAAQSFLERLMDCGVSLDSIYDSYIPGAAARLGELWVEDAISFTGVTLGMARLTEAFRRLSPAFLKEQPGAPRRPAGGQALFALNPGETHALGVVMAADYFQRQGWSVRVELQAAAEDLERMARERPYDVIGISAGGRRAIPGLRRLITRLRTAAHPAARFILGGPLTALEPTAAKQIGVDFAVRTAQDALRLLADNASAAGRCNRLQDWRPLQA